jgi:hypothetical protein
VKIRNISLSLLILGISSFYAMELVEQRAVSSATTLKLYAHQKDLYVKDQDTTYHIEKCDMNPLLREIVNRKALGKFVGDGYIRINKLQKGKYSLAAKVRGQGGGPVTGLCAMWGTRLAGYGSFAVLVWATGGEALLHTAEAMHGIEVAANTAGLVGTLSPLP